MEKSKIESMKIGETITISSKWDLERGPDGWLAIDTDAGRIFGFTLKDLPGLKKAVDVAAYFDRIEEWEDEKRR
jgi:hypothetical protein